MATQRNFEVKKGLNVAGTERISSSGDITGSHFGTFSGTSTTRAAGTNNTQLATTAFVTGAISDLVDSAPGTLDTLNELAAALGDDAAFSTTVTNSIATKLPLAGGTLTGDLLIDSSNAEINLKAGAGGTVGALNWTFNTGSTNYAELKLDYDARNSTGFHIDSGYPVTIDAASTAGIKFVVNSTAIGNFTSTGLYVGTGNEVQIVQSGSSLFPSIRVNNNGYLGSASSTNAIQIHKNK